jgi:hypothetical protein
MTTNVTYTALEFCTEALREAGVVAIDDSADPETFEVAIKRLNMMLKAWQNTAITIWKQSSGSITITNATASYTLSERPLRLDTVTRKNGNEVWLTRMTRQEYNELPSKTQAGTTSSFYYHRQRTQGELFVWPVLATGVGTFEWSGVTEIEDITKGTDVVEIPGEWFEAALYGLAVRVGGAFGVDLQKVAVIKSQAQQSLAEAKGGDVEGTVTFEIGY